MIRRRRKPTNRVAVACSGVGLTWRGFERFSVELASQLAKHVPVVLLSSGPSGLPQGRRLVSLRRTRLGLLGERCPSSRRWRNIYERNVYLELETFSAALLVWLAVHRVEVIFCSEPLVARRLFQGKKLLRHRNYTVIYVDGLGLHARQLLRTADVVQVMSPDRLAELHGAGRPPKGATQIPYGVDTHLYVRNETPMSEARSALGIPTTGRCFLTVAALNREHKRVDYLVRELANAEFDGTLVLCGALEDRTILEEAVELLGSKVVHLYVEPKEMPLVYAASDVLLLASLHEGFCLAAVEAMASGLRVIAHDTPYFRWLLGSAGVFTRMDVQGALAEAVRTLPSETSSTGVGAVVEAQRFSWDSVLPEYLDLLDAVGE